MKKLLNSIILLSCLIPIKSTAQNKEKHMVFTIKSALGEEMPDSIQVLFFKGIINWNYERVIIRISKKNPNGTFKFSLPGNQSISPFTMFIWYGKYSQTTPIYYSEQSDNIKMSLTKNKLLTDGVRISHIEFSGKGSGKYKVCDLLVQTKTDLLNKLINKYENQYTKDKGFKIALPNYYESTEFKMFLDTLYENVYSDLKRTNDTLLKYEKQLPRNVMNFYHYELSSYSYFRHFIKQLYNNAKTYDSKESISNFYFSKIGSLKPPLPKDDVFKFAVLYNQQISLDIMEETNFKSNGNGYPFEVQYNFIKEIKNKELRDISITNLFDQAIYRKYVKNNQKRDSCLNDALLFVKNPELRAALNHQLLFAKGSKMYNFSFNDLAGNKVTLDDLKGKVFIIDFYYYGCGPCSIFAKYFEKEIYPEFANDTNFKILSVNTDRTRESWEKAIKSGLYTQPNSINLSTGVAFDHPIFKLYKIYSLPWVLLIDKNGRVIEFKMGGKSVDGIKNMIKSALNINQVYRSESR